MRHTAKMGCRGCYCEKSRKHELDFDIVAYGRYHYEILKVRLEAASIQAVGKQKKFLSRHGIHLDPPPVARLAPALDLILGRPYDIPHSEWRGLGRVLQSALFSSMLTKDGGKAYLKAFQSFRYPCDWPRMQSPAWYIWSWSLSEAGRATILTPLILRSHARIGWFQMKFAVAADRRINHDNRFRSGMEAVIWAFRMIAECNNALGNVENDDGYLNADQALSLILKSRACYQDLILCIEDAKGPTPVDGEHDYPDDGHEGFIDRTIRDEMGNEDELSDSGYETSKDSESEEHSNDDDDDDDEESEESGESELEHALMNDLQPDLDAILEPTTDPAKRKAKLSKWRRLLGLPNVHSGLHLIEVMLEYSTLMNCSVLSCETRHKYAFNPQRYRANTWNPIGSSNGTQTNPVLLIYLAIYLQRMFFDSQFGWAWRDHGIMTTRRLWTPCSF